MEPESNVLLASIENMQYAVTLDVLQTVPILKLEKAFTLVIGSFITGGNLFVLQVFSSFGPVLKIAMFDKNGGLQALIQYPGKIWIWLATICAVCT